MLDARPVSPLAELQILKPIIGLDSIYVVDCLRRRERPVERFLQHHPVLELSLSTPTGSDPLPLEVSVAEVP